MPLRDAKTTARSEDRDELQLTGPRSARLSIVYCPQADLEVHDLRLHADSEPLLVGRDVAQGLVLPDARMSRLHLRILWDVSQSKFRLGDAQSSNGTFVNGAPVRSVLLAHGDVIRCGDSLLVFELDDEMEHSRARAQRFAASGLTVLVQGETGVGKEVLARFVHDSAGLPGRFVAINCATLSRELVAAELFGHTRGAFSGATHGRPGLFMAAHTGTLLLDEIGDLPLEVQPALLRVLQEKCVRPVGSDKTKSVEVRVIAATHVDLDAAVTAGSFRGDLLARLAQCRITIPPLRQRRSEILPLARRFAEELEFELELSPNAADALLRWNYPFNVRELRTLVAALATEHHSPSRVDMAALKLVDPRLLEPPSAPQRSPAPSPSHSRRRRLSELLKLHHGNVARVARELDCDRSQVYRWMRSLGLSVDDYRD